MTVSLLITDKKELLDLKAALDVSSIVARTDLKGTITYVNDKFCHISQYSREELIGQNHSLLNSGFHPKSLWTEMYRTLAKGKPWHHDVCNRAKDGSLYWVDTTVIGFLDSNNKLAHYIAIRTDITQKKQFEESLELQKIELEQAKNSAEESSKSKTEFLAKMSHELRTPMHSILSFSSIGEKKVGDDNMEKLSRYFKRINQSGERLLTLLNNLLDLSKLQAGKVEVKLEKELSFNMIVDDCVNELASFLNDKKLDIELKLASSLIITADKDLLHQVIVNLLSNAIKFSPEAGVITLTGFITKALNSHLPMLYFMVSDQGVGIPEKEFKSIFGQFTESSRTQTEAGGTGLGLAICKEIITTHGGEIWAENSREGGAAIHVSLPVSHLDNGGLDHE